MPWATTGGAQKAGVRGEAAEGFDQDPNPNLVIPCRRNRIGVMDDCGCIALRLRPVYMRVHDLGGKAPRDTYGSLRNIL